MSKLDKSRKCSAVLVAVAIAVSPFQLYTEVKPPHKQCYSMMLMLKKKSNHTSKGSWKQKIDKISM